MSPLNQDTSSKREWRSYSDLQGSETHRQHAEREFNYLDRAEAAGVNRREFLTLMGASLALAGLAGCRRPVETIVPYVRQPEEVVPGKDLMYATAMAMGEDVLGLVVETQDGRPTKIEGNALHPGSQGGTNAFAQAEILNLYDVHRSDSLLYEGGSSAWPKFADYIGKLRTAFQANGGQGLAVLSGASSSPTMLRLKAEFAKAFPKATWTSYEPVSNDVSRTALQAVAGKAVRAKYDVSKAKVILSLDADFMGCEDSSVANIRGFANNRRVTVNPEAQPVDDLNRLYVVEAAYSTTGGMADHRRRMKASQVPAFAKALVAALKSKGVKGLPDLGGDATVPGLEENFMDVLAGDLAMHTSGGALVLPGRDQSPVVHAIAAACNAALHSKGVTYYDAADAILPSTADLANLVESMNGGGVNTLLVLGGNPVYDAPADLNFKAALAKVENSVHLGLHVDETAKAAHWHLPQTHFLEEWGDLRSVDGVSSVVQPMVRPLFEERKQPSRITSAIELVSFLTTGAEASGFDLVQTTWKGILPSAGFDAAWRTVLHDGLLKGSSATPVAVSPSATTVASYVQANAPAAVSGTEIILRADNSVYDGRYCFNGWLQEAPDSFTKLTWDNAAVMSESMADAIGVNYNFEELGAPPCDLVTVTVGGASVTLPALVLPGMAADTVLLNLGYGREVVGDLEETNGTNVYPLRTQAAMGLAGGSVAKAGGTYKLASTQDHHDMRAFNEVHPSDAHGNSPDGEALALAGKPADRLMVKETSYDQYKKTRTAYPLGVHFPVGDDGRPYSLYKNPDQDLYDSKVGYQWGMAIDLSTCIGCSACTVACQSENNIPIVGRERVRQGREMHWIRIDRYFTTDPAKGMGDDRVGMVSQPVNCMHCENAPCETVCPMTATVHDAEGLNVMVYNRCVGTRYCSNNCPYKVRRFNYFNFTKETPQIQQMANNPDVTVRFRGVIEKCSYCLQRINQAKSTAKLENSIVGDSDLQTACQQACPAGAIAFGNINDPTSQVSRWKASDLDYVLLEEYNNRPRTSYLARVRNPHPELPEAKVLEVHAHHGSGHGEEHGDGHGDGHGDSHGEAAGHGDEAAHDSHDDHGHGEAAEPAHQEH